MKLSLYQYLTRLQIILFSCCIICAVVYPFKYIGEINQVLLLGLTIAVMFSLNKLIAAVNQLKNIYYWGIGLYLLLIIIQLSLFYLLPMVTAYNDGAQIRNEAISLYYNGHFSGERYFLTYPNNINVTLLLYMGYHCFNHINFYTVEHIMIMLSYHIMLISILLLVYRYFDIYKAVKLLILFILTVPFHYYLFYFYTDTVVWCIPTLILLTLGWQRSEPKLSWVRFTMIVLFLIVGYLIKQNIILLLPALIIYLWFYGAWKKALALLFTVIISLQLLLPCIQNIQNQYGFYQDDNYRFPYVHWIMMGISESTFYNWKDYQYTYQQPNYEAKVQADLKMIKSRLIDRPFWRTLLVPIVSLDTTWSEGTLYSINSIRVDTQGNNALWHWLFGNQRQPIIYLIQACYITVLINLVSSLYHIKNNNPINVFIQITLLGVMAFHMFWESNPRYIVIWYPFILLLSLHQPVKLSWKYSPKIIYGIGIILLLGIIIQSMQREKFIIHHDYYVKTGSQNSAYATDHYLKQQSLINHANIITQSFTATQPFNFINIIINEQIDSRYQITLINQTNQQVLWHKIVTSKDLKMNKSLKTTQLDITFNTIKPSITTKYQLVLTRLQGQWQVSLSPNRYIDSYIPGQVYIDNQLLINQDLIFSVGRTKDE